MTFLVIDDSSTIRKIIKNILKKIGFNNVLEASNGVEAWDIYQNNKDKINVILTDWNMPNMNGLELVKKIRNEDKNIPIVMITTESGKKEVITALKAGVNNYIVKPFTPQVLKNKLEAIFGNHL
jgi:two-component system chemotaxis response regulator CheY